MHVYGAKPTLLGTSLCITVGEGWVWDPVLTDEGNGDVVVSCVSYKSIQL